MQHNNPIFTICIFARDLCVTKANKRGLGSHGLVEKKTHNDSAPFHRQPKWHKQAIAVIEFFFLKEFFIICINSNKFSAKTNETGLKKRPCKNKMRPLMKAILLMTRMINSFSHTFSSWIRTSALFPKEAHITHRQWCTVYCTFPRSNLSIVECPNFFHGREYIRKCDFFCNRHLFPFLLEKCAIFYLKTSLPLHSPIGRCK